MNILIYHLLIFLALVELTKAASDVEPAFPQIISPLQINQHKIHIVSESVSENSGYETNEELVDLDEGKNTFIVTNKNGHSVLHIDGINDLIFRYKPYTCIGLTANEFELPGKEKFWSKRYSMKDRDGQTKEMHLYGITAIWMNAAERAKSYSSENMVYSASKDLFKRAHKWTIKDDDEKFQVHLYFIDNSSRNSGTKLTLEMIQFESLQTMKMVQTLNVLSFEYSFSDSYDSLMRVPVGYGCMNSEITSKALTQFPTMDSLDLGQLLEASHKIDLEATATKFEQTNEGVKRSSDTLSYQIAHTNAYNAFNNKGLQLIRQRDSKQDVKTIFNYQFNVEYKIDMRKGSCELRNMGKRDTDRSERISLLFNNGLRLAMDIKSFKDTFVSTDGFFFIGRSRNVIEYLYFEKTTDKIFEDGRNARVIRTYSTNQAVTGQVKLESVTIWVFDRNYDNIVESYHLNVLDVESLENLVEVPKTFDISEECYLNNEKMVQGKDYVWYELHYPVPTLYQQAISRKTMEIKNNIYTRFAFEGCNFFLMPRMEFIFEDTGFILRILQLDIPSIPLLYDLNEGTCLSKDVTQGDVEDLAVDLDHCADLCRLSNCKTMSYCEQEHTCLLSTYLPDTDKHKLNKNRSCKTYFQPTDSADFDRILASKLQRVVSDLQHQDYGPIALPKMPDELSYPRSETGVDDQTYAKIMFDYLSEVRNFISKEGNKLPMLSLSVNAEGVLVILLPNKFELEQDPLSEFTLTDKDSSLDDPDSATNSKPPFHEGLSMHRYKVNAFNEAAQKNSRLFTGLTYDQCSLACVDARCSSFSYCMHRQECIITDIYSIGESMNNMIEVDSDCMIAQRDFVSKFNRFQNVYRPNVYAKSLSALNPSECAHSCVIETNFKCLAFDFCSSDTSSTNKLDSCLLLEDRQIYTGIESTQKASKSTTPSKDSKKQQNVSTGCDHYSRSYLADFLRIEYRQIDDVEMFKLKTSLIEGRSVDQCADKCVNEITDCTAFQFCFDPDVKEGAMQTCIMIESKPENSDSNQVVVDEKNGGEVIKTTSKLFVSNRNCHVFALRRDTSEAHLRDLALNGMTNEEFQEEEKRKKNSDSGMSLGGVTLLYFSVTFVFAAIGCGIVMLKHHNELVRQKIERIQLLLGI